MHLLLRRVSCSFVSKFSVASALWVASASLLCAQGVFTFSAGENLLPGHFKASEPLSVTAVHFQENATLSRLAWIDLDYIPVTMESGSGIYSPDGQAYALRFDNVGGSLVADGATLRASQSGVLLFQHTATVSLTNTTIEFNVPTFASNAAAVSLQNGGTFTAVGGAIGYTPGGTSGFTSYAIRSAAGALALSLTDVEISSGATTSSGVGISLTGGGTVDLLGGTSVTAYRAEALALDGAYTVKNEGILTRLDHVGAAAANAVRLKGGVSTFTNTATGQVLGWLGSNNDKAIVIEETAAGSTINNAGRIDGIHSIGTATNFTVVNSGTIALTGSAAIAGFGLTITNEASGEIASTGSSGISGYGLAHTVTNRGTITGTMGMGLVGTSATILNEAGATITGTNNVAPGIDVNTTGAATLTNRGTISGFQGANLGSSGSTVNSTVEVSNTGTITGNGSYGLRVAGVSSASGTRNVVVTNEATGVIQGGLGTTGSANAMNAAVTLSNAAEGAITLDNYGTIDARNRVYAIYVGVASSVQATINLHTGSSTIGAIRGENLNSSLNASVTLAFNGTGTLDSSTSGINRYLKADAGTWVHAGQRQGGRFEVTGGTLVLKNYDTGSSTDTIVTNGTLRLAPDTLLGAGFSTLKSNNLTVDAGGRLEVSANARANFGGSGGAQTVTNGGLLLIDGIAHFSHNQTFAATVTQGGVLAGTGRSVGYLRMVDGGIFDAGDGQLGSAGIYQAFESGYYGNGLMFGDGGLLRWTLASLSETGAGVNFDQINVGSLGLVTYEEGARFAFDFSATGVAPSSSNAFWATDRVWSFVTGDEVIGGENLLFAHTNSDTYAFAGIGYFTLGLDGRTLTWTADAAAIPEPSTWAAILGGLALTGAFVRRRLTGARE
jgi:hypothetical protein